MGAVLTPALGGLAANRDLPQACTLNGKCQEVCPVAIPLPTLLRGWRERSWREGLEPATTRWGVGIWAWIAQRPRLYRAAAAFAILGMRLWGGGGWIRSLPLAAGWTRHRDMPSPEAGSFMAQYARGRRR
jgi:L-lactate dehydrogenase complex protein LldF